MTSESTDETKTPQSLVTEDLVRTALRADKGDDAELGSWQVKDFTKLGDNYACFVSSVAIDFEQGGRKQNISYVVKLNPCRNVAIFEKLAHDLFVKEGTFYRDLVPVMNKCLQDAGINPLSLPRFVHLHLEPREEVLFLEDLRPRGFKMLDRMKGQDAAHAILVLKELGKLHAASVLLQQQAPETSLIHRFPTLKDWFCSEKTIKDEQFRAIMSGSMKTARSIVEGSPGYEHVLRWIDEIEDRYLEMLLEQTVPTDTRLTVINHGDCWNNNLLFRYDDDGRPVEVILLDLQVNRVSDATVDLNYFLFSSFNGDDRRANLDLFLDTYYISLKEFLGAAEVQVPFTLEELRKNYLEHNLFGVLMAIMVVPLVLMEAEDLVDLNKYDDGSFDNVVDDFDKGFHQTTTGNPRAKARFLSVFDDLIEQGIIKAT